MKYECYSQLDSFQNPLKLKLKPNIVSQFSCDMFTIYCHLIGCGVWCDSPLDGLRKRLEMKLTSSRHLLGKLTRVASEIDTQIVKLTTG